LNDACLKSVACNILLADESIQFGNKKLLLVLAVPEQRCRQGLQRCSVFGLESEQFLEI